MCYSQKINPIIFDRVQRFHKKVPVGEKAKTWKLQVNAIVQNADIDIFN